MEETTDTAAAEIDFDFEVLNDNEVNTIKDSINSFTKTYFAADSISSWIEQNLESVEKCSIELKNILIMFEEATDKKMSVKQLKVELEELGFTVKKNDGIFMLKNWRIKKEKEEEKIIRNEIYEEEDFEIEEI